MGWTLHHCHLAMPPGSEDEARRFYGGLLGMDERPKPPVLAARGGMWFRRGDAELHLGVESDFRAARKVHPALMIDDDFDGLVDRLVAAGLEVRPDNLLPGFRRCYVDDPFGNRLELLTRRSDG